MRDYLLGLFLAVVTCVALWYLPRPFAIGAAANLLTLIGAVYVGFALASPERMSARVQSAGCAVFFLLALAGMWHSPWFIVAGLALHGVWDLFHHREHEHGSMPGWYVPACMAYDWTVAAFIGWRLT